MKVVRPTRLLRLLNLFYIYLKPLQIYVLNQYLYNTTTVNAFNVYVFMVSSKLKINLQSAKTIQSF